MSDRGEGGKNEGTYYQSMRASFSSNVVWGFFTSKKSTTAMNATAATGRFTVTYRIYQHSIKSKVESDGTHTKRAISTARSWSKRRSVAGLRSTRVPTCSRGVQKMVLVPPEG
jgi:hypothetical protein